MTLAEIIKRASKRLDVKPKLIEGFVYEVIDHVREALDSGETVKIRGLGTLHWKPVPGHVCGGVRAGLALPPGKKLKFTPSQQFKHRRTE
jgi:nucleoid DNA-binding protein